MPGFRRLMKRNYALTIRGKVQGVGFRYYALKKAAEHHVAGFVRNMPGQEVYIVAEGEETDLETFSDHLRIGPSMARVREVLIEKSDYTGSYEGFVVRY